MTRAYVINGECLVEVKGRFGGRFVAGKQRDVHN